LDVILSTLIRPNNETKHHWCFYLAKCLNYPGYEIYNVYNHYWVYAFSELIQFCTRRRKATKNHHDHFGICEWE
jgi:hypothetical protein